MKRSKPNYKAEFLSQLALLKIQTEAEFRFHPERRWRSDWRIKATRILIEFEGGLFGGKGGHSSVSGILRDCEKYNEAALAGWTVIRITPKHVTSGQALQWVERAMRGPFYVPQ